MKKTLNRTERVVTSAHGMFTVKHCDKNKTKRIYLAHNSRLQTILAGNLNQQELDRTGHITSIVRTRLLRINACMRMLSMLPLFLNSVTPFLGESAQQWAHFSRSLNAVKVAVPDMPADHHNLVSDWVSFPRWSYMVSSWQFTLAITVRLLHSKLAWEMAPQQWSWLTCYLIKWFGTATILKVFIWTVYQILGLWDVLFEMTEEDY